MALSPVAPHRKDGIVRHSAYVGLLSAKLTGAYTRGDLGCAVGEAVALGGNACIEHHEKVSHITRLASALRKPSVEIACGLSDGRI